MSQASPSSLEAGQARANILFAVIAVVLLVAAGAGIYFAKQRSSSLSESSTKKPEVAVTTPKTPEKKANPSNTPSDSGTNSQKKTPTPPASTPKEQTPSTPASTPSDTNTLPSTGPNDTLVTVIALTLVTFSGAAYLQSRRTLAASRL